MSAITIFVSLVLALTQSHQVSGEGFLGASKLHSANIRSRSEELQAAMGTVMGCGEQANRTSAILRIVNPIWHSLPKNQHNRVEWRQLRYVAHRYFMQQLSIMIRGLEPVRELNALHNGAAEILSKHVPTLVDTMINGQHAKHGFSLEDATSMIAVLEQLIFDSESSLLEQVYKEMNLDVHKTLDVSTWRAALKAYMVHWLMADSPEAIGAVLQNEQVLTEALPHWPAIYEMVLGTVKSMEFERLRKKPNTGSASVVMTQQFSFDDAHEVVKRIGGSFASFWETECQAIKANLIKLDKTKTGRVRLSDFYGANMNGDWRFGESEAYLRDLGALDETSSWRGKQVIIPNYLQATSNCIVARPNYLVCCVNECEAVLGEIEKAVGAPVAELSDILGIVGNTTDYDDELVKLDEALIGQLQRIADTHGGKIPVHGRLFAQWLHFVFPRECPFPHKVGKAAPLTPSEYGDNYIVTQEEINLHTSGSESHQEEIKDDEQWMSQWSEEEELIGDYSSQIQTPWESRRGLALGGAALLGIALLCAGVKGASQAGVTEFSFGGEARSHFV